MAVGKSRWELLLCKIEEAGSGWATVQTLHADRNQLAHHHPLSFRKLEELNERLF